MKSHYVVLGVDEKATDKEIKDAWKKLVVKHHPDKGGKAEDFIAVNEAYEILINKEKREIYDAALHHENYLRHTHQRKTHLQNPYSRATQPTMAATNKKETQDTHYQAFIFSDQKYVPKLISFPFFIHFISQTPLNTLFTSIDRAIGISKSKAFYAHKQTVEGSLQGTFSYIRVTAPSPLAMANLFAEAFLLKNLLLQVALTTPKPSYFSQRGFHASNKGLGPKVVDVKTGEELASPEEKSSYVPKIRRS